MPRAPEYGDIVIPVHPTRDEDYIKHLVQTTNKSYLLFFTNRGRVYRLKAYRVPRGERTSRGTAIVNLLQLQEGETIQSVIAAQDYEQAKYLLFVTAKGVVKKTLMAAYDTNLRAGLIAINLRAPLLLIQAAVPHLKRSRGCVLNIGSLNGYCGEANLLAYSMSKGGLMTMSRNLANYLGPDRVRVQGKLVGLLRRY